VVLNARLAKQDLRETIAALKQEPGKDLLVLGSGQIVSALAQSRLLDEYWLFVAPVVLGSGKPCSDPRNLDTRERTNHETDDHHAGLR
jgi:dihydrofolate reductase